MPLGEAMLTQRAIRRLKSDPIDDADLEIILNAARRAPSGGNLQPWRFVVVRDADLKEKLAEYYVESWWHRRRSQGITRPEHVPKGNSSGQAALYFTTDAGHYSRAPVLIVVCNVSRADNVMTACQNLMLAARALGIGSVPTTLHAQVMERVYKLLDIPPELDFHLCIPLGYPRGRFGPTRRRATAEVTYLNRWGTPVPWAAEAVGV
jgi:nitroreductase